MVYAVCISEFPLQYALSLKTGGKLPEQDGVETIKSVWCNVTLGGGNGKF